MKQIIVIGLGQFGMSLVKSLSTRSVEVLAIDSKMELVNQASEIMDEVLCLDATDESELEKIAPQKRDACIVAIGDESKESSIICTALLKQLGAKKVISRANDPIHERILYLVGANEVVNPERDFGERFANRIVYDNIIGELPLGEDLLVSEIITPKELVGKSLKDLQLPRKYGITVVAIRNKRKKGVMIPKPDLALEEGSTLILVSPIDSAKKFMEKFG
ncbi:MAG: TrkA family potassium uptake protein [Leptospiraceae bacterium]|nr:TrkA family potassium uptake protein [Leptospiraceae bacterium]MCP5497802.1 TrkA family potassium uptake protein [Leptospiraceae bacterium]